MHWLLLKSQQLILSRISKHKIRRLKKIAIMQNCWTKPSLKIQECQRVFCFRIYFSQMGRESVARIQDPLDTNLTGCRFNHFIGTFRTGAMKRSKGHTLLQGSPKTTLFLRNITLFFLSVCLSETISSKGLIIINQGLILSEE